MNRWVGILVIVGGACLMLVGLLIYSGGLNWFTHSLYSGDRIGL